MPDDIAIEQYKRQRDEQYPDLAGWCGHAFVSLRDWQCPDCNCSLSEQTKQRLLSAPSVAPEGQLWIFQEQVQRCHLIEYDDHRACISLFTDRTKIARRMVRDSIIDAESLRKRLAQIHWYQGVFNVCLFEGWDEDETIRHPYFYALTLQAINRVY